jgi:hypothetical protein
MIMSVPLDDVLELGLKLPAKDRLQLIEKLASSLEGNVADNPSGEPPPTEHWGKALNKFVDTLDMSDWEALDIDDPVAWLEQQREAERKQRLGDWGETNGGGDS